MFTLKVSPAASNVLAWGNNGYGQLGTGTSNSIERAAVSVSGVAKYTQVSAGEFHACGIVTDGTVDCWGYNGYGQLGDGTTANKNIPVKVAGISRATKLFAGPNSTCAISDGKLWCWGYGSYGLLGNGRTTNSSAPVQALISDPVSDVVGSTMNMCAMTTSGVPYCWGNNGSYQVGVPRSVDTTVPVPATELFGATKLAVSGMSTCGIFSGGAIKCLGSNWSGELGNGTTSSSQFLVNVIGASSGATKIVGSGYGFCAIVSGSAKCWGPNDWGNMGTGTKGGAVLTATEVLGMQGGVTDIDVKSKHACAVQGGAIKCWGTNDQSQLGTGNTSNMFSPVQVVGMSSGKTGVALGEAHTYAW